MHKCETRQLSHTTHKNQVRINSKWVKDFKVKPDTIKLEESIGSMLFDFRFSNIFLDMFPQSGDTKAKINKWDSSNLNSFCPAEATANKM